MDHADCLFCRIARNEIPARFVHESAEVVAFLDIRPIRPGHLLVVPRAHHRYFDDLPEALTAQVMDVARRLAPALRSAFGVERVGLMFTGVDVAHAHAHLVPMVEPTDLTSPRYIEQQPLSFRPAPPADPQQLQQASDRIRAALRPPDVPD